MFHRKSMTVVEVVPCEIYDSSRSSTCCWDTNNYYKCECGGC